MGHLAHFPAQSQKIKKYSPRKKFLIFQEMELSNSSIKNNFIYPEIKPCTFWPQPSNFFPQKTCTEKNSYVFSKKTFLIFPEMKPYFFHPKPEK